MDSFTDSDWYKTLQSFGRTVSLGSGESLTVADDPWVGFITQGRAHAVSYSENGEATWLGEYGVGDCVGIIGLLSKGDVQFELRADTPLSILKVSEARIRSVMDSDSAMLSYVAADLARRLDGALLSLIDTHTLSVKGRICVELLRLSVPIGLSPDKQIIRPSPVFVDLARRINSTRETVSRTVNELARMGVITREPGALVIQKTEALKSAFQ